MLATLKNILLNSKGFKSKRKIVVIESDDWGALRMPSKAAYNSMLQVGIPVNQCGYSTYDSLETVTDLQAIFEMFESLKTKNHSHPVITANTIVANPDYRKIKDDNFETYHFETIEKTFNDRQGGLQTLALIKEGMERKFYFPQLHGREHVFINNWMSHLKAGDTATRVAFDNDVFGLSVTLSKEQRKSYLSALDFHDESELVAHEQILKDAQQTFQNLFGFSSESFIAPNYTWHPKHEPMLKNIGVKYIQGGRAQKSPTPDGYTTIKHYMGEQNKLGQHYIIRNASFEPSTRKSIHWHKKIMQEAKCAFLIGAPLVISTHRVNFMGGIVEQNRTQNIALFKKIMQDIIKQYPDVEFMTSVQLGKLMSKNN